MREFRLNRFASGRGALLLLLATLAAPRAAGALSVQPCVSDNNDLYLILTTGSGSIGTQVTTVALGAGLPCSLSEAGGGVLSALAANTGTLLPDRMRTAVLSGFTTNAVSCQSNFDPSAANGAGLLTLPGGTRSVSADGTSGTEALIPVTTADAGVPAVQEITASRSINMGLVQCSGNTMAFPVGGVGSTLSSDATGEAQNQSITLDDTGGSRVGNGPTGNEVPAGMGSQPTTPDGFLLRGSCGGVDTSTCQIIVFVARSGSSPFYGVSAAGYTVDSNLVQGSTEAAQQNGQFLQFPPIVTQPAPVSSPGALVLTALVLVLLQFARLRRGVGAE